MRTATIALPLLIWACSGPPPEPAPAPPSPREAAPKARRIVVYSNANTDPVLASAADYPYTHYILAFLVPDAKGDVVPSPPVQAVLNEPAAIRAVQAAGKKVMVSLGGGAVTAAHWLDWGSRAYAIAGQVAGIVEGHGLDGVGMDVENLPYTSAREFGLYAEAVVKLTNAIAARLPDALVCHAPQPPYLCAPGSPGCPDDSLYAAILAGTGDSIDWLNMQYYSNPPVTASDVDEVSHYESVVRGWEGFPGLPAHRLVVGKPYSSRVEGYQPVGQVVSEILDPLVRKYGDQFGGFMAWEYSEDLDGDLARRVAAALGR